MNNEQLPQTGVSLKEPDEPTDEKQEISMTRREVFGRAFDLARSALAVVILDRVLLYNPDEIASLPTSAEQGILSRTDSSLTTVENAQIARCNNVSAELTGEKSFKVTGTVNGKKVSGTGSVPMINVCTNIFGTVKKNCSGRIQSQEVRLGSKKSGCTAYCTYDITTYRGAKLRITNGKPWCT